jgi:hypothetical protein
LREVILGMNSNLAQYFSDPKETWISHQKNICPNLLPKNECPRSSQCRAMYCEAMVKCAREKCKVATEQDMTDCVQSPYRCGPSVIVNEYNTNLQQFFSSATLNSYFWL